MYYKQPNTAQCLLISLVVPFFRPSILRIFNNQIIFWQKRCVPVQLEDLMKSQKKNLLHKHRHPYSSICHINSVILHFSYNSVDRIQRKHDVIVLSVLMFEILSERILFNQDTYIVWFNGSYFFYTFHKCFVINILIWIYRDVFLFSFFVTLFLSAFLCSIHRYLYFIYIALWVPFPLFLPHAIP